MKKMKEVKDQIYSYIRKIGWEFGVAMTTRVTRRWGVRGVRGVCFPRSDEFCTTLANGCRTLVTGENEHLGVARLAGLHSRYSQSAPLWITMDRWTWRDE